MEKQRIKKLFKLLLSAIITIPLVKKLIIDYKKVFLCYNF